MQKWEYQVFRIANGDTAKHRDTLDRYGLEGWELVSVNKFDDKLVPEPVGFP